MKTSGAVEVWGLPSGIIQDFMIQGEDYMFYLESGHEVKGEYVFMDFGVNTLKLKSNFKFNKYVLRLEKEFPCQVLVKDDCVLIDVDKISKILMEREYDNLSTFGKIKHNVSNWLYSHNKIRMAITFWIPLWIVVVAASLAIDNMLLFFISLLR